MSNETRVVDVELEVRAEDGKPTRLIGYAAKFNEASLPMAGGRFVETIQPGAFRSALSRKENVPLLIEHAGLALADTTTGTLTLTEDARGLRFEAQLDPSDPDVQRVLPKLSRGTLRKMSFGFQVADGGAAWNHSERPAKRSITNIEYLSDVSLVTNPAYPSTDVALRSLEESEKREAEPAPAPISEPKAPDLSLEQERILLAEVEQD